MAKDPAFPFYAQDYLIDTMRWDRDMKSLHVDLLAEAWVNGWPANENGHPHGLSTNEVQIWQKISYKWKKRKGFWVNIKLLECKRKRDSYFKTQRINGLKGGRPRNPNKTQTKPMGFENENPNKTQTKPYIEKENEYIIQEEVSSKVLNNSKKKEKEKLPKEKEKPEFENACLQKAWLEWEKYRKEIKHPLKPMTKNKQINFLNDHPPDESVAMLDQSMQNGWTGLFELKNKHNGTAKHINGNSKTAGIYLAIGKLRNQAGR